MADKDYVYQEDEKFEEQSEILYKGITKYMTEFNLTQAQIDEFGTRKDNFKAALQNHIETQILAKTATGLKNDTRALCEKNFRTIATFIQNNPNATNESKQECGLPIHDTTPSVINPVKPDNLIAKAVQSGTIVLNWKKGGNKQGTIYVIERKLKDEAEYSFVDVSTAT